MQARPAQSGFSLVELSIVLVILGLLTGGILGGQALIRAAELRSVSADFSRFTAASYAFRDKYMALAGDMRNATAFWGDDNAACPDAAVANGSPGTCNGDGNGRLDLFTAANGTAESYQFWKQLALAGLVEGNYSGLAGSAAAGHSVIGSNVPRGRISQSGVTAVYWDSGPGDGFNYSLVYGNMLSFGRENGTVDTSGPILRPEESWNIDTKIDDGMPGRGKIIATYWATCATSTSPTDYNGLYRLNDSSILCALRYSNL